MPTRATAASETRNPVDPREVRALLTDACGSCHGPDPATRRARLRFDLAESFLDPARNIVVPGRPEDSELLQRVRHSEPSERMPPPESGKTLTDSEIELLRRWIEEGARFETHWSFVAPAASPLPEVSDPAWPRRALDHFVLAMWDARGLRGSPEARPATWVRRLYVDLIGLPPTVEELGDALALLEQPGGYETLVRQLLDSPHYGERWARPWLDLARYADTNGYEKDRERSIWPYRDWVVEALNEDLPYDQFTLEQLAGDLLPNATLKQRIATGFHRNTMLNEEGGIDPLEFRYLAMVDRVNTTGTTWLGLTVGCAQCHTHKFDPLTQSEYFSLMACLDNADEVDLELPDEDGGALRQQQAEQAATRLAALERAWFEPEADGAETAAAREAEFMAWAQQRHHHARRWQVLRPIAARSPTMRLVIEDDDAVFASGDCTKDDLYEVELPAPPIGTRSVRLEALPDPRLPAHGPGTTYYEGPRGDFFLGEWSIEADGAPLLFAAATHSYAKNRFGNQGVGAPLALDGDVQTGWSTAARPGERHVAAFELAEVWQGGGSWTLRMRFGRHFASSLGRFRIAVSADGNVVPDDLSLELNQLLRESHELNDEALRLLRRSYLLAMPEHHEAAAAIRPLLRGPNPARTLVFEERPADHPRITHRHHRGEYLQAREAVAPDTPAFLHAFPDQIPRDRLGFARWLVAPENPLFARVAVNRVWAELFGAGLVRTLEDFGTQGALPTHPELLDTLAVAFVEHGYSMKWLHEEIVCSATYRQSSAVSEALLAGDPDGRWLTRLPRRRLDGERLRDAALVAAGLLDRRIGGPPVRPPQPEGVTEVAYGSPRWHASAAPDRFRRSLYTFAKRTAPFALYQTFGAPSGEHCTAQREPSNTALQALALLNDVVFQEAAQALGERCSKVEGDDEARLQDLATRVLARSLDTEELEVIQAFVDRQRRRVGDKGLAEAQLWSAVARTLLALDEATTRN